MTNTSIKNLKWISKYIILAAVVSYGLSFTTNNHNSSFLPELTSDVCEAIHAYRDGMNQLVIHHDNSEYWEVYFSTLEINEGREPTLVGTMLLEMRGHFNG